MNSDIAPAADVLWKTKMVEVMSKNKYGGINDMESGWTKVPENKKVYMLWFDMLRRCYDDAQIKRDRGSSYKNCIVCDRWFYLSKFYEDIQKLNGYKEWTNNGKMSLDKDIFSKGAKIYSPETCCFVPVSINISEANARNPQNIKKLHERRKVKYVLSKSDERLVFDSEKEACEAMGVHKCSIASCYRRGYKCKGYEVSKLENERDTKG